MSKQGYIDIDQLFELRSALSRASFLSIYESLRKTYDENLDRLRIIQGNAAKAAFLLHDMRGNVGFFGMVTLAATLSTAEELMSQGRLTAVDLAEIERISAVSFNALDGLVQDLHPVDLSAMAA
jgi:hypothetical protein